MPRNLIDILAVFDQVMAWCRQAPNQAITGKMSIKFCDTQEIMRY